MNRRTSIVWGALLATAALACGGNADPGVGGGDAPDAGPTSPAAGNGAANGGGDGVGLGGPGSGGEGADAGTPGAPAPGSSDGGGATSADGGDAGATTHGDGGTTADGGAQGINACGQADYVNGVPGKAQRTINFGTPAAQPTGYEPRCLKIKAGEAVDWAGNFTKFPLVPSGGSTPTPIPATSTGASLHVTFATPGIYGYKSTASASTAWEGAIEVVQ